MVGIFDLFGGAIPGTGLFGAPQLDTPDLFTAAPQTGDIGGAPGWGKPPVPGGPGAVPNRLDSSPPGGPEPGAGVPMGDGKPIGLLRAGDDDFRPGAGGDPAPLPLLRAGLEGAQPVSVRGIDPVYGPAEPQGPPIPAGLLADARAPGRADGPPLPTPQQAAAARITPGTPGQPAPVAGTAVDPALRSPYATPGSALPGGGTAGPAAAAAPGGDFLSKLKGLSGNKDFMGALGKLTGAAGGGGGGGGGDGGMSPGMGDPTGASRANASKLFESILAGKGPRPVAPVPQLPPGLLELFRV